MIDVSNNYFNQQFLYLLVSRQPHRYLSIIQYSLKLFLFPWPYDLGNKISVPFQIALYIRCTPAIINNC